ncbi:MAG: BspA family leucine-rich repeat surface protein, partial [Actinomycetes bacterium]
MKSKRQAGFLLRFGKFFALFFVFLNLAFPVFIAQAIGFSGPTVAIQPFSIPQTGALQLTVAVPNSSATVGLGLDNGQGVVTNVSIDWGDGSVEGPISRAVNDQQLDAYHHQYPSAGSYQIQIYGDHLHHFGLASYENQYITSIDSWGTLGITDLSYACSYASNLTSVPADLPTGLTSMDHMFSPNQTFNQDLSSWDVSSVTNMDGLFSGASSFNNGDTSGSSSKPLTWETTSLQNMNSAFSNNPAFNQPLPNWDTSNVTSLDHAFSNSPNFNQDISDWDTSNVTNMNRVFESASAFNQPLNSWDVSSVQSFEGMFDGTSSFNQELTSWDTSEATSFIIMFRYSAFNNGGQPLVSTSDTWHFPKVNSMSAMFNSSKFNQDISSWDVSNITDFSNMFEAARDFNQDLSGWDMSKAQYLSSMFNEATNFNNGSTDGSTTKPLTWNVSSVQEFSYMFQQSAFNQSISNWNTASARYFTGMFSDDRNFNQNLSSWNTANVQGMNSMFRGAVAFNNGAAPGSSANALTWDTSSVTDFASMFYDDVAFNSPISSWNTANGANFNSMFSAGAVKGMFNQDISSWNMGNAQYLSGMFSNGVFNQDVSKWNTSKVQSFAGMFQYNKVFNNGGEPLVSTEGHWSTAAATDLSWMFCADDAFNQPVTNWDTSKVTQGYGTFFYATGLDQDLSSWNLSSLQDGTDFLNGTK